MTVRLFQTLRNNTAQVDYPKKPSSFVDEPLDATESTITDDAAESLETVVVELQHDLRAKAAQCDVLRDTLAAMSAQLKEQEERFDRMMAEQVEKIEQANEEATKQKRLLTMKEATWQRNEERYEALLEEKDEEVAEWKCKYDDLMLRYEELENKAKESAIKAQEKDDDSLLGAVALVESEPDVPFPEDSVEQLKQQQQGEEEEVVYRTDDDSIQAGHYGEIPDTAERPSTFTNRVRPYRRKKRGHPIKKFKMMPMSWIGNNSKGAGIDLVEAERAQGISTISLANMSLDDMYTDDESVPPPIMKVQIKEEESSPVPSEVSSAAAKNYDAECRRRRIRRAAKKKSRTQGFDVEQVEC